jgi:chemotaxis protein CheD
MKTEAEFETVREAVRDREPGTFASLMPLKIPTRSAVYLHPGHAIAASEPTAITTILGSCVSICLWDSRKKVGGMNHYLLPTGNTRGETSLRFGTIAIPRLIDKLLALGCKLSDVRAKVFGGACVLEALRARENHLGKQNVELAMELLAQSAIPVIAADAGGQRGRKVIFYTDEGTVQVKRL